MENDKDKIKIETSMSEIKRAIQKDNNLSQENTKAVKSEDEYLLLDNIISGPSKLNPIKNVSTNNTLDSKKKHEKIVSKSKKISSSEKKIKKVNSKAIKKKLFKQKDPVAIVVDREIKPIIKQWINKNLRSFVKSIVIEEMKGISKATEKPSSR